MGQLVADGARGSMFVGVCLAFSVSCAANRPSAESPRPEKAHAAIELPTVVVTPYSNAELAQQFQKARSLLVAEAFATIEPSTPPESAKAALKEAAAIFDRLSHIAPDGAIAAPSLYNAGIAYEALGARDAAALRYKTLAERFPDDPMARGGALRQMRLLAYLERWDDLLATASKILAWKDVTVIEAIEAHGMKGLALVEHGDRACSTPVAGNTAPCELDEAAKEVAKGRDLIEQNRIGEAGKPPVELASVSFALAEVRRIKSERISFSPLPPNFTDALEQRCTGLLDAQSAYTEAMRSLDAHWSAMAGYRVGQLYQRLHRDVMQITPPAKAETLKRKQLFEGAMRLRYRVLLEKGLKMMDGTVRLGERTGEDSTWMSRARDAKRDLELALEDEKAAMSKLPYTEAELAEALEALKK